LNGRENVVAKKKPFLLVFYQIVAWMLSHHSVFAGFLLVAILFSPLLNCGCLPHWRGRVNRSSRREREAEAVTGVSERINGG